MPWGSGGTARSDTASPQRQSCKGRTTRSHQADSRARTYPRQKRHEETNDPQSRTYHRSSATNLEFPREPPCCVSRDSNIDGRRRRDSVYAHPHPKCSPAIRSGFDDATEVDRAEFVSRQRSRSTASGERWSPTRVPCFTQTVLSPHARACQPSARAIRSAASSNRLR